MCVNAGDVRGGDMNIFERQHEILTQRILQLRRNKLALKGGRPYIDARLWRAPNESDLSWTGKGSVAGRRDRASLVNDAGRVAEKIGQYLFKKPADRVGIDDEWKGNVDGGDKHINLFWMQLSDELTAGQWVWVGVDRLAPLNDGGTIRNRTLAEKIRDRDYVRWTIWPSVSVPDWSFGRDGRLNWVITESVDYNNSDPYNEPETRTMRTLWRRDGGSVVVETYSKNDRSEGVLESTAILAMEHIPFVLVGTPSTDPWWYDDVEMMQAQGMNLDSLHVDNLVKTVFPQLVIAESMLESLETRLIERVGLQDGERIVEAVREVVRGLDHPLIESSDDKGITRFLQPSGADLKVLSEETERKRRLLFDSAGLALFNKESRQIQTAESKQFDQLDTESTLQHRAMILQEVERKLVALSKMIDPLFVEYDPVWPRSFDVVDIEAETRAISMISHLPDRTPSMIKIAMLASVKLLESMSGVDEDLIVAAREEIESYEPPKFDGFPFDAED